MNRAYTTPYWARPLVRAKLTASAGLALLALAIPTCGHAQPAAGASFTRIALERAHAVANDAVWMDYNNDGFLDAFISHTGGFNALFLNDRAGGFNRIVEGEFVTLGTRDSASSTWADFNNDGFLDVLVANWRDPNWLFANDGSGGFTRLTEPEAFPDAATARYTISASWADFDKDGYLDLFLANGGPGFSRQNTLYRNVGGSRFESVTGIPPTSESRSSMAGKFADYDNDGDFDLFVTRTANQGNVLFRNDGTGEFTKVASAVTEAGYSIGIGWGDYDNDGFLDLFVTNFRFDGTPVRNFLYRNRGDGGFTKVSSGDIAATMGQFIGCAWGDYDNDGWLDLFVADMGPGKNLLFRNLGNGTFERITQGDIANDLGSASGCAWGDFNNDGFLDLIVNNKFLPDAADDSHVVYRNHGNGNHWIKFRCVGTVSNRSAVGARLHIEAVINGALRKQIREVGQEGSANFVAGDVVVGLGDATSIKTVRIVWPSGTVQELHDVAANQTLRIIEPPKTKLTAGMPRNVEVHSGYGRPFRLEATTDFASWTSIAHGQSPSLTGKVSIEDNAALPQRFYRAAVVDVTYVADLALSLPGLPEGLTLDAAGNAYVSIVNTGEIRKITPGGTQTKFAQLPGLAIGMAADLQSNLYVCVANPENPANTGLWKIDSSGSAVMLAKLPPTSVPNDVTLHPSGDLYVTDSVGGIVHKITPTGETTAWASSALLLGIPNPQPPHPAFPIGANGLAFSGSNLFVANTDLGTIVRIPVQSDGSAAEPVIFRQDAQLWGADGIIADAIGNLYVANIGQNTLLRVTPNGRIEQLADARDGLDGPSSLRFGTQITERAEIYFVNYAFLTAVTGGSPKPSLMRITVPIAGTSIPGL